MTQIKEITINMTNSISETILYSNKIFDPNSTSVSSSDKYYVCHLIDNHWHIIEGATNAYAAFKARNILTKLNFTDKSSMYQVFKKGLNEVKKYL